MSQDILDRLAPCDEGWCAAVPASCGAFLGRPVGLMIVTYEPRPFADPSPPPTGAELALAAMILDNLPALLEEARKRFIEYNTGRVDDPGAVERVARPQIWMSRDVQGRRGAQRWSFTVARDDCPLAYAVEFDGLRYVETWAAT